MEKRINAAATEDNALRVGQDCVTYYDVAQGETNTFTKTSTESTELVTEIVWKGRDNVELTATIASLPINNQAAWDALELAFQAAAADQLANDAGITVSHASTTLTIVTTGGVTITSVTTTDPD